eukprot:Opistho-2@77388
MAPQDQLLRIDIARRDRRIDRGGNLFVEAERMDWRQFEQGHARQQNGIASCHEQLGIVIEPPRVHCLIDGWRVAEYIAGIGQHNQWQTGVRRSRARPSLARREVKPAGHACAIRHAMPERDCDGWIDTGQCLVDSGNAVSTLMFDYRQFLDAIGAREADNIKWAVRTVPDSCYPVAGCQNRGWQVGSGCSRPSIRCVRSHAGGASAPPSARIKTKKGGGAIGDRHYDLASGVRSKRTGNPLCEDDDAAPVRRDLNFPYLSRHQRLFIPGCHIEDDQIARWWCRCYRTKASAADRRVHSDIAVEGSATSPMYSALI